MNLKKAICIVLLLVVCFSLFIPFSTTYVYSEPIHYSSGDDQLMVNVLGLESDGDCTIIRLGDIQILIDASETQKSFEYLNKKMAEALDSDNDKKWDYIIFTHPDEDHIGNAEKVLDLFYQEDTAWSIGTIIDYDFKEADENFYNTQVAKNYRNARNKFVSDYDITYFSAAELSPDNKEKKYDIGENANLYILYNYYDDYDVVSKKGKNSRIANNDKNLISVCCLITYGDQKLLFTGDLEESGEAELVNNHYDVLKNVTFFKAGHHGSGEGNGNNGPANTQKFIDCIKPAYVAITKMERANDPDESITRFLKYTDYIYPTYVYSDRYDEYFKLFGDEVFYFNGERVSVNMETNMKYSQKPSIWDAVISVAGNDEYWFSDCVNSNDRGMEDVAAIYTFDEDEISGYCNCTLIKHGHNDILIDCGSMKDGSTRLVEKLKDYVVDGIIEYVIISHNHEANISQMIGTYKDGIPVGNGVFDVFEIENIIDNPMTNFDKEESFTTYKDGYYQRYNENAKQITNRIRMRGGDSKTFSVDSDISFTVFGSTCNYSRDEDDYSLVVIASVFDKKCMFLGDLVSYDSLMDKHIADFFKLTYLRLSNSSVSIKKLVGFENFIKKTRPEYSVIGTPLEYKMSIGKRVFDMEDQKALLGLYNAEGMKSPYFMGYLDSTNHYKPENGDLEFYFRRKKWDTTFSMSSSRKDSNLTTLNSFYGSTR